MIEMHTMRDRLESIAPDLAKLTDKQAWYMAGYVAGAAAMARAETDKRSD